MTFLLSPLARYAAGAGVLCLAFLYWLHGHDAKVKAVVVAQYATAQAKADKVHQLELDDARKERIQHAADLAAYIAANPVQPVFVCPRPHTPAAEVIEASASPGPAPADVQPVPEGDSAERPSERPDIGPLLNLLALRADEVSGDLREQQAVK
jgi:hypothetical protein